MRKIYFILYLLLPAVYSIAQPNLTFNANLTYPFDLANIGGYVDSLGNEYALVGTEQGLSIVDVTTPTAPVEMFAVPGVQSQWREVKTHLNYAYVTNEAGDGLQIVNLGNLPTSVSVNQYHGNGAINNQLETIHALHIDGGFAYLFGSNLFNGAAVILDLNTDPWNPVYLGHTPGNYIHDGYVRNDTLWAGHIYDGEVRVYNCTNKANPALLSTWMTPGEFTHNTWLSQNSNLLFTTDEVNDSYLTSYDVTDLTNVIELGRIQTTPGSGSIVHNTHILNVNGADFAITSWYKDGVVIHDVSRPGNMIQIARYDTYTQGSGSGFSGCWGVYPYLPSQTIVVSDINNGLYVLSPNYVQGCYLEGIVTDSVSGVPLNNVSVQILTTGIATSSKITGEYKTGTATAGTYDVQFSKAGYITKTITGVSLTNGVLTTLDVQLVSLTTVAIAGQVLESVTLNPIANAKVLIQNSQFTFNVTTNGSGNFSISNFYPGVYDVTAGIWGHRTNCTTGNNIQGGPPITIILDKGYYDDFILDFNWTTASGNSSNDWERGEPIGTSSMGTPANPELDVVNDCGDLCFITDNGGGSATANDVDDGYVDLTSPIFDATLYTNPQVNYYRWFTDLEIPGNGNPVDTMTITLNNGITTVTLESIYNNSPNNSSWVARSYIISSLITPTANMQLRVRTADFGPVFSIVEGGLDKFEVVEGPTGVSEIVSKDLMLKAYPNPFSNSVKIEINASSLSDDASLIVTDVAGRMLMSNPINKNSSVVELGSELADGFYLVHISDKGKNSEILKIAKTK